MRSLPMLLRLADDLKHLTMVASPFYENPWMFARLSPWSQMNRRWERYEVQPKIGKDGYQMSLDVSQFKPSELKVKVVDNSVVVEGKHEMQDGENGYYSRQFIRSYALPQGFEADQVVSTLSSDGLLTVSVPKPAIEEHKSNERIVQIQQSGPAHLNVKENSNSNEESADDAKNIDNAKN